MASLNTFNGVLYEINLAMEGTENHVYDFNQTILKKTV